MKIVDRLLNRQSPATEAPCPRCGIPAPATANECSACGWDLREAFTGAYAGSHIGTVEDDDAR